jgi:hypothetical protein
MRSQNAFGIADLLITTDARARWEGGIGQRLVSCARPAHLDGQSSLARLRYQTSKEILTAHGDLDPVARAGDRGAQLEA